MNRAFAAPPLEQTAKTAGEQSPAFLSDEEREDLIQAYHRILCLEPQRERKRFAQTRMYELVMQRPKKEQDVTTPLRALRSTGAAANE